MFLVANENMGLCLYILCCVLIKTIIIQLNLQCTLIVIEVLDYLCIITKISFSLVVQIWDSVYMYGWSAEMEMEMNMDGQTVADGRMGSWGLANVSKSSESLILKIIITFVDAIYRCHINIVVLYIFFYQIQENFQPRKKCTYMQNFHCLYLKYSS